MINFNIFLLLTSLYHVAGYPWLQKYRITSPNTTVNQYFGQQGILSSDSLTLIIGSPGSSTISTYLYDGSTSYILSSTFQCCPTSPALKFSLSLSTDGNTLAVGAPNLNGKPGSFNIYSRQPDNTWNSVYTGGSGGNSAPTGTSIALSGDGKVCVATADNRAFVFANTNNVWNQEDYLTTPTTAILGVQVAMAGSNTIGTYAYVALGVGEANTNQGGVYTYFCQDWASPNNPCGPSNAITNPNTTQSTQFGRSLSMANNGTLLAIGSYGAVYIYQLASFNSNIWNMTQVLADAPVFGSPVALSADGLVLTVGATDTTGNTTDTVYTYQWYSNKFISVLPPVNGTNPTTGHNSFGASVNVLSGAQALTVGAPDEIINGIKIGAAYIYQPATPSATASASSSATTSASGSASASGSSSSSASALPTTSAASTFSASASYSSNPTPTRSADPATYSATQSASATSSASASATATGSSTGTTTASSSPQHSEAKTVVDTAVFAGSLSAAGIVVLLSVGAAITCYWKRVARANLQRAGFHVTYGTTGPSGSVMGPQSGSADAPHGYITL